MVLRLKRPSLEHLERLYAEATPESDGRMDTAMVPFLRIINDLKGICTLESCSGHKHKDGTFSSGKLWVTLDRGQPLRGDLRNLLRSPDMERVRWMYYPEECLDLVFLGEEHNRLGESMDAIISTLFLLQS